MYKLFLKGTLLVTVFAFLIGFVLPMLFSAKSTEAVFLAGLTIMAMVHYVVYKLIKLYDKFNSTKDNAEKY